MRGAPALVVFLGGFGSSPVEQLVDGARAAASLDAIEAWMTAGLGPAVLVTEKGPDTPFGDGVVVDTDEGTFHFGRRLAGVVRKYELQSVVYMGGGSLPMLESGDFRTVAERIAEGGGVTNNLFSSDFVAFPVTTGVLPIVQAISRDNSLARALHETGSVKMESLPRTVKTQFDIDTPGDLAILALTGQGGPNLRDYVGAEAIDVGRYTAVLPLFLDQTRQITVAGRVGTHAWSYLERETACRVRLFAEERGMEADGRADSGDARSLLGFYIDEVGPGRFFATLAELGDAAFIDTRVLLAHRRINATREDRFLSDLGDWRRITDPFLRDFTRAALAAPIPVLLGGHSIMSGGLMALNEYAWSLRDAGEL